jgi:glycerol-3-phosphate dehydrogenase
MHHTRADIAIFGGGIAGLWTLARLRQAGYFAVLFESRALGGLQTIASQGIIHGGVKYALTGNLTESARAIGEMPGVWRACLEGSGELDLSQVRVLSDHQYLWSSSGLVSRMTGFFASKAMRSRMTQVEAADLPEPFRHPGFNGSLYRLEEQVLDVASLVTELVRQLGEHCYQVDEADLQFQSQKGDSHLVRMPGAGIDLEVNRLLLAAGRGNAGLLQRLGRETPAMQLRPLHMVVVKGELPPLFAHCLGSGTTPRITVTSCPTADGSMAWYLGGQLAEGGNDRTPEQQIGQAQRELTELLPYLDLSGAEWSSLRIDRAEPKTAGGARPDGCFLHSEAGVITAWPTKLAFAPRLAQQVLQQLQQEGVAPRPETVAGLEPLPHPPLATTPWEMA